ATPTTSCRYASTSSGAFDASVAAAERRDARVSSSTFCGEAVKPNPLPCVEASSRMSSLLLFSCSSPRYFARAPASPNVSVKSRSLIDTSIPAPVTPFSIAFHSCSVKSALLAITTFLSTIMRSDTMPAAADTATLGLPAGIRACLFDLDGVLTPTARIHAAAWKEMFDAYLRERASRSGRPFEPFEQVDY